MWTAALEDASPEAKLKVCFTFVSICKHDLKENLIIRCCTQAAEQRILTLQKEQSKIIQKRQTLKLSRPTSAGSSAPAMTLPSRTHVLLILFIYLFIFLK